jgi:hypothetical protein
MLKRYMKEKMFEVGFADKSYIWKNIEKNLTWAGGVYEVPVQKQGFTSVGMGVLPGTTDIAEANFAVGTISGHKEMIMSAIFNEADLTKHNYSEQTYLDKLPGMIDGLTTVGVEQMEAAFLRGSGVVSYATANGAVGGTITVANPEYFQPGMKVEVLDNDTAAPAACYVTAVDINTGILTIQTLRSGGANVDLSLYTTAQNARVRMVGSGTEAFLDLKSALLPAAVTGGSDSIYGLTKASYLPLQAKRKDGSAFTASTILKDLLKEFYQVKKLGRGNQTEIWVSLGVFANAAANLETARQFMVKDKAAGYGFNSITLVGNEGEIKLVGLKNAEDSVAHFVDWSGLKFAGLPIKKKMYGEAGQEYFTVRNTTGIQFVSDIALRGDFVIEPQKMAIVHSIPSSVAA